MDSVSAGAGSHELESYLVLHPSVSVDDSASHCMESECKLVLSAGGIEQVDIYVMSLGSDLSYMTETFDGSKKRLIVRSVRDESEEFWLVLHPHEGNSGGFSVSQTINGHSAISFDGDELTFAVNPADHAVSQLPSQPSESDDSLYFVDPRRYSSVMGLGTMRL